jgi:hypothetical protein
VDWIRALLFSAVGQPRIAKFGFTARKKKKKNRRK